MLSKEFFRCKVHFVNLDVLLYYFNETFDKVNSFFKENYIDLSNNDRKSNSFSIDLDLSNDEKRNSFYSFFLNVHRLHVLHNAIKNPRVEYARLLGNNLSEEIAYMNYSEIKDLLLYKLLLDSRHYNFKISIFSIINPCDFLKWFEISQIKKNIYETSIISLKKFNEYFIKSEKIIHTFNSDIENTIFNNYDDLISKLNELSFDIKELYINFKDIVYNNVDVSMISSLKNNFIFCDTDLSIVDKKFENLKIIDLDSEKCLDNLSLYEAIKLNVDLNESEIGLFDKYLTSQFNTYNNLYMKMNDLNKKWVKYFVTNLKLRHYKKTSNKK